MFARWILVVLLTVFAVNAIQRPDTKTTLRGLARMPRAEFRVSLDFDSERGFVALRTSKDSILAVADAREKLNKSPNDGSLILELAGHRMDTGDAVGARRDMQRAADALRRRLDVEPGNSRIRLDLATALHGLNRQPESEALLREAVKIAPGSITNRLALSAFLEARAWEIAADVSNWKGRRPYAELCNAVIRREPANETADRAARYLDDALQAAREAVSLDERSATAQHRLAGALASKQCFQALRARLAGQELATLLPETLIFSKSALPALEKAATLEPENPTRLATALLWRGLVEASAKRIPANEILRRSIWESLPEDDRRQIDAGFDQLEKLAIASKSAAAHQALGTLRFALRGDLQRAADDLRHATARLPESDQIWETLSAILLRTQDIPALAEVCESRAAARPTVRNQFLLAKAHEKLGNFERAQLELLEALAINTNDFAANVGMAQLLMRDSTNQIPSRVRQSLINAERAIRGAGSGSQLVELALAQSLYHGLNDESDRAREILKAALAVAKDHPEITAALNAIGH